MCTTVKNLSVDMKSWEKLAPIAPVAKASSAIMQHVNKPNPQIGGSLPVGGRKIDWKKIQQVGGKERQK